MKKLLILAGAAAVAMFGFTACDEETADAAAAGLEGYSYIGHANSESECSSMAASRGYTYYRFNSSIYGCYGKN